MHKKVNGYFTVEATCILPIVLFLYLLIILAALFLYRRCIISQDNYLLSMRAGRFTDSKENYGEVIYGADAAALWQPEVYVKERVYRKSRYYPDFSLKTVNCIVTDEQVSICIDGNGLKAGSKKVIERVNPIKIIRKERKHVGN